MIRTLHIDGFKSIHSETISLARVDCFIGTNCVCNGNVLSAIGVLGEAVTAWWTT